MLQIEYTTQFRRDLRRAKRRTPNTDKLQSVMNSLQQEKPLPPARCDHALTGPWAHHRECHIAPDWLLIYKVLKKEAVIIFVRTGSHADLFN